MTRPQYTPLRIEDDPERQPPANIEAEQYLLGELLINNSLVTRISGLGPEHFANEAHRHIWTSFTTQVGQGAIADPITLKNILPAGEHDWPAYLTTLARTAAMGIPHPEDYAQIIIDLAQRRELIALGQELTEAAYAVDDVAVSTADLLERHQAKIIELAASSAAGWPDPADLLGEEVAPPFPIDFLPGVLADFALDQAARMQCPLDFVGIPLIIIPATLIGKDFRMAPKALDSWAERACLWGAVISAVGSKKTAAFNSVLAPVWRMQADFHKAHQAEMEKHKAKVQVANVLRRQWEKDAAAARKAGKELPEQPEGMHPPAAPTVTQIMTNDTTQERLAELMAQNPHGIALYRDELSGWFATFNQYRAGADEQFFLQCHAGGAWAQDRKSGNIWIDDLFLNVFGGFQPEVVNEALGKRAQGKPDNGMTARFSLLVWPNPVRDFQYVDRRRDTSGGRDVEKLFRVLYGLDPEGFVGARHPDASHYDPLRFIPDAQDVFRQWYMANQRRLAEMDEGDPLRGHFAKYDGLFARLALVHHLVRHCLGQASEPARVDHQTAVAVRDLIETYLIPHALKVYRRLGRGTGYHGARRIAEWIAGDPTLTSFTARDISQKDWSGLTEPADIAAALQYLENVVGWIMGEKTQGPGRPTIRYLINPKTRTKPNATAR